MEPKLLGLDQKINVLLHNFTSLQSFGRISGYPIYSRSKKTHFIILEKRAHNTKVTIFITDIILVYKTAQSARGLQ